MFSNQIILSGMKVANKSERVETCLLEKQFIDETQTLVLKRN